MADAKFVALETSALMELPAVGPNSPAPARKVLNSNDYPTTLGRTRYLASPGMRRGRRGSLKSFCDASRTGQTQKLAFRTADDGRGERQG
jgi:hypothetical protein